MTIIAVLDADVLYPMVLRDTLLRAAGAGCFRLHWSSRILDEVTRNLIGTYGMAPAKAEGLRRAMSVAFPEAEVEGWERLEARMTNDPKDRHVVAAAVAAEAAFVVTSNLRDFRSLPEGVIAVSPDQFLQLLADTAPQDLALALADQLRAYRNPPMTLADLMDRLAAVAPGFVAKMADR